MIDCRLNEKESLNNIDDEDKNKVHHNCIHEHLQTSVPVSSRLSLSEN